MRTWLLLIFWGIAGLGRAQLPVDSLQSGDLVFLDLDCGPLCEAIEAVTQGYQGHKFSHVGLVCRKGDSLLIVEAIGRAVCTTPLTLFLGYSKKPALASRLHKAHQHLLSPALHYALSQLGQPYDDDFLPGNGKWYCSELIQEAFYRANGETSVFPTEPMTFKMPGSNQYFPAWEAYFARRHLPIPEGIPGCNPGGLSRSPYTRVLGWILPNDQPLPVNQKN